MDWVEQKSSMRYIVFDEIKKDKDEAQQYLVKKGEMIYCIVGLIEDSRALPGKKWMQLEICDKDGKTIGERVSLTPPRYLEVALGLDPEYEQKKVVSTGDFLAIKYLGRDKDKEGKPYTFKIYYGS